MFKLTDNVELKTIKPSKKAIEIIKKKKQPVFIELFTYRWLEHCGPNWDDDLGYRKQGELNNWLKKCPIKKIENDMLKKNKSFNKVISNYNKLIDQEIEKAFKFAKKSNFPDKSYLYKHVYK